MSSQQGRHILRNSHHRCIFCPCRQYPPRWPIWLQKWDRAACLPLPIVHRPCAKMSFHTQSIHGSSLAKSRSLDSQTTALLHWIPNNHGPMDLVYIMFEVTSKVSIIHKFVLTITIQPSLTARWYYLPPWTSRINGLDASVTARVRYATSSSPSWAGILLSILWSW